MNPPTEDPAKAPLFFGLLPTASSARYRPFSVPISKIKCSSCSAESVAEYVGWYEGEISEQDKNEAASLLAALVEKEHPDHKSAGLGPVTLGELRERVARKARRATAT